MKIVKPMSLCALHKPYRHGGRNYFVVAALGFFKLGADNPRLLSENLEWPRVLKALPAGQALDEAMPKERAEVLVLGSAHSPGGRTCTELRVRVCVAGIDKTLLVTGEREWRAHFGRRRAVGKPTPFSVMPLTYERAFGGPGHAGNPLGCGYAPPLAAILSGPTRGCLPNIALPDQPPARSWRRSAPAGFGPLQSGWAPRKHRYGTYDKHWLQHDAPGFARDLDRGVFNLAPPDQQRTQFFSGGEPYCLQNLHPQQPVIAGVLPRLQARAFIQKVGQDPSMATEVTMRMDTVWFLPELELGVLVFHGETAIDDSDALDVAALMVAYEAPDAPKSPAHYRSALALRLDPATAAMHVFNESQLSAERPPEELARRAAAQEQALAIDLALRQQKLDEMDADFWAGQGGPPTGHSAPRAEPHAPGALTGAMIADGEFDLVATMEQARAQAEAAQCQADAAMADLRQRQAALPPADSPSDEQVLADAIERAAIPAYDLLPAAETGVDPRSASALAALETAREGGHAPELADPARYIQARGAIMQAGVLRRQARQAAATPAVPGPALGAQSARQFGVLIRQWHASGICLAGRDLAGANLAGTDFSGGDLREVMLECADLSGASFVGANLQGAVLAGACLDGADFSGALLAGANLSASAGSAIRLRGADLRRALAMSANWPGADLSGATLDGLMAPGLAIPMAVLDDIKAAGAMLAGARAGGSSWQRATLDQVILLNASLEDSDWRAARLTRTVVIGADMRSSRWDGARWQGLQATGSASWRHASLQGVRADKCGLHGASFASADLRGAHFLRCDFGRCDMHNARLDDGVFSYSLFMQTTMRCASARRADFFQAMCRKTDFCGADLLGASFAQCELSEAAGVDSPLELARKAA
jgi:uncharacterized protein YjbI with pentapeptide repeats